ncbi:adhesive domain-containing protein [Bacillus cytotoxicus]|uniref:Putative adhesive domain-containing protein n=1 Tax=Bacillus cytotoxicus TaxID=580165 RepID=A0AAX2CDP0_9BACI|nr:hypothetical protein [Bacillus cytotoxicus]QTR83281.1 hypothetical protein JC777_01545 [Bacillus cytotoxicus]QTR87019.1 hypothetical protein JC774_21565 [Bacillus cytotoxicus]SCL85553.1 Protein of unknown function [Bacillus cytotoxicus]
MREGIRQLSKVCLASGIILTQVSTLGAFSTTAYAITENQISDFIIKADKDQVKINENVVLTLDGIHNQDQNLEVVLPDGMKFNEQETAKLNEKNPAIGTIQMIKQSVIQIERTSEGDEIGKVFLVITGNVVGEHTITAKAQRENNEIETKVKVNVSENAKTNPKKIIQQSEVNDLGKVEENQEVERKGKQKNFNKQLDEVKYAAPLDEQIQNLVNFKDALTAILPGDSAFMIRHTPETKVIASGYTDKGYLVVNADHPTGSLTLKNVGYYKGKK